MDRSQLPESRFQIDQRQLSIGTFVVAGLLVATFGTQFCTAQPKIGIEASKQQVGKYEKVEFRIDCNRRYENPSDPSEADLGVILQTPSGDRLRLPAFYCQQYQRRDIGQGRRRTVWLYPDGNPVWKAKFAPAEVGNYEAVAYVKERDGETHSKPVHFTSVPSDRKGFVRVSQKDPRFFEFSEGQPFFPIGQNLAFIGEQQYVKPGTVDDVFAKLSSNGANYLRIWTCCKDWALAIEARKSAWGRSWGWRPPFVPMPDGNGGESEGQCVQIGSGKDATLRVLPSHAVALRPETRYVFSGRIKTEPDAKVHIAVGAHVLAAPVSSGPEGQWNRFRLEFETGADEFWLGRTVFRLEGTGTAWVDALSLTEADGGPELLWEAAVNRRVRGFYNPVDSFMLDEVVAAAEKHGIYLQLCLITRDLYMNDLRDEGRPEYQQAIDDAKNLFRYAVARWGYSTNVVTWEYFNEMDPGMPTDRFYAELGEYLDRVDIYGHLRSTSTWHHSSRDCRLGSLDVADVHFYLRPVKDRRYKDEVEAALGNAAFLREHAPAKPALIGEFGLANERWQPTKEMRESEEVVDFHNAIWASALSGTSGTALFWWWDRLDRRNAYPHYRPLATFLADVPWTTARRGKAAATVSREALRLVSLRGQARADLGLWGPQAGCENSGVGEGRAAGV
ncbi:MAG: DUF5060 domain-containing protein, partial [Planctomycetes bacterium]|nr:DUF5060 domain-containing protein [Planctomycetota bacterium]